MMFKILAIISLMAIAGAGWAGYFAGGNQVRAQMAVNQAKERKSQNAKISNLIKLNKVKKVVYRDKIKRIRSAKDSTNCADTAIPADILDGLR